MQPRVVLLNSGGKDTLAAAMILKQRNYEIHSLHVDVDSKPHVLKAAKAIAAEFCASHEVMSIRSSSGRPYTTAKRFKNRSCGIEGQRAVLPLLAVSYALTLGIKMVASGHRGTKVDLKNVLRTYADATLRNRFNPFDMQFEFPVLRASSAEIMDLIKDHPLWKKRILVACHFADPPCGRCDQCHDRAQFIAAHMKARDAGQFTR